jgi:hypothetical protein
VSLFAKQDPTCKRHRVSERPKPRDLWHGEGKRCCYRRAVEREVSSG